MATKHNNSLLILLEVFSLLLLKPANFLDIGWQPLSLQTPVVCWLAYPVLLSHLEFPIKKSRQKHYWLSFSTILKHQLLKPLKCSLPAVPPLAHPCRFLPPTWKQQWWTAAGHQQPDGFWQQQKQLLSCFCVTLALTWKFPARTIKDWGSSFKCCCPWQEWGCFASKAWLTLVKQFIVPVSLKKDPNTKQLTSNSHCHAIMELFPLPWLFCTPITMNHSVCPAFSGVTQDTCG